MNISQGNYPGNNYGTNNYPANNPPPPQKKNTLVGRTIVKTMMITYTKTAERNHHPVTASYPGNQGQQSISQRVAFP
jgi:hypothetical protein